MKLLRGIIHVHSTYSYDGRHSLAEIVEYGRQRGYDFVGMSDHADTFDSARMAQYVSECRQVSNPGCALIEGLEFTCGNDLHILGLGIQRYTPTRDPLTAIDFIHQEGGIAIVAHPIRYDYQIPPDIAGAADGIEVWNASYDGRFVPNLRSLRLLRAMRRDGHKAIRAFGGPDLHRIGDHHTVEITVACSEAGPAAILDALKCGRFTLFNPYFRVPADGELGVLASLPIQVTRHLYNAATMLRDTLYRYPR